jgi:hypothetical protein
MCQLFYTFCQWIETFFQRNSLASRSKQNIFDLYLFLGLEEKENNQKLKVF